MIKKIKETIQLGDQVLKNRIVSSPVSINMANDFGQVTPNIISFFSNLAQNNIAMVCVGALGVNEEGRDSINCLGIGEQRHLRGLNELTESIKKSGAKACGQLLHVGAQGNTKLSGARVVGPSKYIVPDIGIEAEVLSLDEIKKIEDDYVKAVLQADDAGFDFIEIHLAHGYLLHQFLSEHTNKRKDIYGGSEENRIRIVSNILEKVYKKRTIKKLAARVTGEDFTEKGLNIKKIAKLINFLDKNNFCYYSVTAGIYETAKQKYTNMKRGTYWEYSQQLKKITQTPVIAQGNITSLEEGEKILSEGKGDMISMAQALIADPELVSKSFSGKSDEVFNCLAHMKVGSCHRCRYVKQKDHSFDCVTPSAWRPVEENSSNKRFDERKKDLEFWKLTVEKLKKLETLK